MSINQINIEAFKTKDDGVTKEFLGAFSLDSIHQTSDIHELFSAVSNLLDNHLPLENNTDLKGCVFRVAFK